MTHTTPQSTTLKDWGEVLGAVCKRPRMYAASGSLRSALDFIGGYLYAQGLLSPEPEPEWRQFNYWLARKFGYPRNYPWHHAREYFSTDEEALQAFPRLLAEFRGERAHHPETEGRGCINEGE